MKALSLWPPWGTLMAHRLKRVETRSWATTYRGLLAVHQTATWRHDVVRLCHEHDDFRYALLGAGYKTLDDVPLGAIVAVVKLIDCVPTAQCCFADAPEVCRVGMGGGWQVPRSERPFGDYAPGRFAWLTDFVARVDPPVECRGWQGLWGLDAALSDRLARLGGNNQREVCHR